MDYAEDRTEYLIDIGGHVVLHVANDGGADEVAIRVRVHGDVSPIKDQFCALVHGRLDHGADPLLSGGGYHGPDVSPRLVPSGDVELGRLLGHLLDPVPRLAHHHRRGERHAPLSGRSEGRAHKLVDGVLLVGVRHDNAVVLGAHVALHPLAISRASLVYVPSGGIPSDKGDSSDVRIITNEVDTVVLAVDDIDHAVRKTGLLEQLEQRHAGGGVPLTWLHDVGVATDGRHREHPERDHGGEVEGRDTSTHPKGRPEGGEIHVLADSGHGLAQQQVCVAAAVLHHLQPSHHVALGVGQGLALLQGDQLGQLSDVGLDELLVSEHDLLSRHCTGLTPGSKCRLGTLHCLLHLGLGSLGHLGDHLVSGGVVDVYPSLRAGLHPLTVDDVLGLGGDPGPGVAQTPTRDTGHGLQGAE